MPAEFDRQSRHTAVRLVLRGRVQGLGVRPTIVQLAKRLRVCGTVANTSRGVEIEVEGATGAITQFCEEIPRSLPAGTEIKGLERAAAVPTGRTDFTILRQAPDEPPGARFPPDMGVCNDCLRDIADTAERRHRYPFTSCTACGPRYTMIREMPYERPETTMGQFPLCTPCETEYTTIGDRRFHAQSTACPDCGPQIWCTVGPCSSPDALSDSSNDALQVVQSALLSGKIVAVRGIGGYQLLVDATDESAVCRLRERKRRPAKPLAILVPSVEAARELAVISSVERSVLIDRSNPIVLVSARPDSPLANSINPGLDTIGLMLPTTPLHTLIAQGVGRPLVCTSANREGEPLEYEVDAAEQRLEGICDVWLHHNRPIARPIDDSVIRVIAERPVTIRLARGLAPYSLDLPADIPMLAVGGHLKGSAAWSNGVQAVLGPHIGDQEGLGNRERLVATIDDAKRLYRFEPELVAHDLHPDYFTTEWAENVAQKKGTEVSAIQHHHAHVAAGMLEHGWLDRQVLGVAWDGTGYGTDQTIWGGEFLLATATAFERVAMLRPFRLPGGEAAVREPWRVAAFMLADAGRSDAVDKLFGSQVSQERQESICAIGNQPEFSPQTTSAGRLFDAVAAIALGELHSQFDGQPAMWLEAAANRGMTGAYEFPVCDGKIVTLDWRPLIAAILTDRLAGEEPGTMAMRFHRALATGIVNVSRRWSSIPVVLTGGVFQNRLLTELVLEQSAGDKRPWGTPGVIPPGDGGLAAGQLAVATSVRSHAAGIGKVD